MTLHLVGTNLQTHLIKILFFCLETICRQIRLIHYKIFISTFILANFSFITGKLSSQTTTARIFVLSYFEYEWLGHASSQICSPQETVPSNSVILHLTNNHLNVNNVTCSDIRTPSPLWSLMHSSISSSHCGPFVTC